jgi:voltage-gated potassium channel
MGVVNIGYILNRFTVNRFTEAVIEGYFQEGMRLRQQRRLMESLSGDYIHLWIQSDRAVNPQAVSG